MRKTELEVGDSVQVKMFRETSSGRDKVFWMDGKVVAFGRTMVNVRVKQVGRTWPFRGREIRWPRR
jgi:hypothetical protein